jgi:hypothetical protein
MRKAGNNACRNGIAESRHDYWNCRRDTPRRRNSCCVSYDDINVQPNQLGYQTGEPVIVSARKAKLNLDVLAFDVTEVTKTNSKCLDASCLYRGGGRQTKVTDPSDPLRPCDERPRRGRPA